MLADYLRLSRPKDWIKNVFVLLPVPFALASGARLQPVPFVEALVAICLAGSAVYAFNDARDVELDRQHHRKRHRPVASGRVSVAGAYVWSALLAIVGLGVAIASRRDGVVVTYVAYLGANLVYCLGAKHVPLLDVFLLASGFVLRVLLGCAALDVPPSNSMLLCSYALALLLALGKRRGDLVEGLDETHRPVLGGYNREFLEQAMTITATMALVGYAFYCTESPILVAGRKFASLPFAMFGVIEYLRIVRVKNPGSSPVDLLVASPSLIGTGVGWLAAVFWSVHL